jgi:hypothetical protein
MGSLKGAKGAEAAEATQQSLSEFEELTQNFTAEGFDENGARDKAYLFTLPTLHKDLQNIYLERLLWIRHLKRDPVHKKIMETRDVFVNNDNFDYREVLEAKKISFQKTFQKHMVS